MCDSEKQEMMSEAHGWGGYSKVCRGRGGPRVLG